MENETELSPTLTSGSTVTIRFSPEERAFDLVGHLNQLSGSFDRAKNGKWHRFRAADSVLRPNGPDAYGYWVLNIDESTRLCAPYTWL